MPDIFICYQRDDSPGHAGRLQSDLQDRFGSDAVFFDREKIRPGVKFPKSLRRNLEACRVLVVVIGPDWDAARLHVEDDWVCHEIAYALQNGKVVVPVLVDNGTLPPAEALPASVASLTDCQYVELDDAHWNVLVADLAGKISHDHAIPLRRQEPPPARWTAAAVSRLMRETTIALCLVLLTLTFCVFAIREFSAPALSATKLLAGGSIFVMFARVVIGMRSGRSSQS
jgi:hypothetical protein